MTSKRALVIASVGCSLLALLLAAACNAPGSSGGTSAAAGPKTSASIRKFTPLTWHQTLDPAFGAPSREALLQQLGGTAPEDVVLVKGSPKQFQAELWFALRKEPVVSSTDITEVHAVSSEYGPSVEFTLSAAGGERFRQFTRAHIGDCVAIVLDNQVISNPRINSEIGDKGSITGNFTPQEVQELVERLKK